MGGEDDLLLDAAGTILDGGLLDWNALDASLTDSARALLVQLRAVAAIGTVTRRSGDGRERSTPTPPATWGHLKLLDWLGHGAFGTVYRAWDSKLDREVALKLLSPDDPSTSGVIEEGRLLARVHHPNVVTIFGADRIDGWIGLWMEVIHGETLEQLIRREGRVPLARARDIVRQLCDAVGAVHAAGLVHRDIKTQNVMVSQAGRVVLMDFGAGAWATVERADMAGTPLYLAPEIFDRRPSTPQSDIYALGVVLYRLLSGAFPIEGCSLVEVREAHQKRVPIADVRTVGVRLPRRVAAAVSRTLDRDPSKRFQTARALAEAIQPPRRGALAAALLPFLLAATALLAWESSARGGWFHSLASWAPTDGTRSSPRSERFDVPADARFFLNGLSWDGRSFAYAARDGSVRQLSIPGREMQTLVEARGEQVAGLTVSSPDGSLVAYQWWTERQDYEIRVVDRRTRSARVLLRDDAIDTPTPVEWSRDGRTLLVLERLRSGTRRIVLLDVNTGVTRVVRELSTGAPLGATLSPDTGFIAYDLASVGNATGRSLHIVRSDGSGDHALLSEADSSDWAPLWTADGRGIFFLSDRSGAPDGWFVPVSSGTAIAEPQLLVRNLARVLPLGLTDSGRFYYRVQAGAFDIFEVGPDGGDASAPPRRLGGRFRGTNIGVSYAPDGQRIAYISVRDGYGSERDRVVVIRDLASAEEREIRPLTDLGVASPRWSPDNRTLLVRGSSPDLGGGIHAVDSLTGSVVHVVASVSEREDSNYGPMGWDTTPDGAVYEHAQRGLVRHSVATGAESVIYPYRQNQGHGRIHRFGFTATGGVRLAFSAFHDNAPRDLIVVDKGVVRTLVSVPSPLMLVFQAWSGDGAWVYYSVVPPGGPPHELWRVHASGGAPERQPFMIPGATQINPMSLNPATGALAYTGGTPSSEVWTMDGFLPR